MRCGPTCIVPMILSVSGVKRVVVQWRMAVSRRATFNPHLSDQSGGRTTTQQD